MKQEKELKVVHERCLKSENHLERLNAQLQMRQKNGERQAEEVLPADREGIYSSDSSSPMIRAIEAKIPINPKPNSNSNSNSTVHSEPLSWRPRSLRELLKLSR